MREPARHPTQPYVAAGMLRLSPAEERVVRTVLEHGVAIHDDLVTAVYGRTEHHLPTDPLANIRILVHKARMKGWPLIPARTRHGTPGYQPAPSHEARMRAALRLAPVSTPTPTHSTHDLHEGAPYAAIAP